jgi:membrane protein required for colicin V production
MIAAILFSIGDFTFLDWIVLAILIWSIAISLMKGFVRELLGLGSLLLAFLLGAWFYRTVAALFKDVVRTENLALFLGFFIVFLGTLLAGSLAIWIATRFVKFAKLQWFDRLLGAAFGIIRGWVLGSVIFLGLTSFGVQSDRVRSSQFAPFLLPGARVIAAVTPEELKARFMVGYQAVEKWWREQQSGP